MLVDLTPLILGNQVEEFVVRWYFVPGFRDAYCVGSNGSVWSRLVRVSCGRGLGSKSIVGGVDDWRELSPYRVNGEYMHCSLQLNGRSTTFRIHQLVASLFIGPCPLGLEVCHNDGNKHNNHVCNLRYDTSKNNKRDKIEHGTDSRGERNGMAVLSQDLVNLIREEFATGEYTYVQLGRKHGVDQNNIGRIIRNERWVQ